MRQRPADLPPVYDPFAEHPLAPGEYLNAPVRVLCTVTGPDNMPRAAFLTQSEAEELSRQLPGRVVGFFARFRLPGVYDAPDLHTAFSFDRGECEFRQG